MAKDKPNTVNALFLKYMLDNGIITESYYKQSRSRCRYKTGAGALALFFFEKVILAGDLNAASKMIQEYKEMQQSSNKV
jgi:hypothetical protein